MLDAEIENTEETNNPENLSQSKESTSEKNDAQITSEEKATAKAVESIEEQVAAEAEGDDQEEQIPVLDFDKMDLEELVGQLEKLVKHPQIQQIKSNVEPLKKTFDMKFAKLLAEKKATFLEEGGESIDFHYSSPVKTKFNSLIADYKKRKNEYYSELDKQLKENLNKRIEVIDQLKQIIETADSSTMYKDFKELQNKWKSIGAVPRTKYNTTWRNYHHHVERFYDLLHINNDLRDLDFKHNLEEKIKIVEKAEALTELEDVNKAFKKLQELHKMWKEDVGPVSREFREDIWQKFSVATKKIHDKRDQYFESQKSKYEENVQLKIGVIETLEQMDVSKNKNHSDWQKSIKSFEVKREEFFQIGRVPRNKSQQLWDRLKVVTRNFNHSKNKFYKDLNHAQQDNLEKKLELVKIANELKDSDDFTTVTGQMKKIQSDWKKIGHVPRKHSDRIWKEFKDACNHYFDRLHSVQDQGSQDEIDAFETKTEFLSQINGVLGNKDITIEEVKAYLETWKKIGRVPKGKKAIELDFNKAIEKLFNQLDIKGEELDMLKYRMSMDVHIASNNRKKIENELQFVRKKIDEITKNIQQLENNISFIANAEDDNPLVKNVNESIAKESKQLAAWRKKMNYLKTL